MRQIVKKILMMGFIVCTLMVFGSISPAFSLTYSITQMSSNNSPDYAVRISNNGDMTWVGPGDGGYTAIYVWDETAQLTRRLTSDVTTFEDPQINNRGDIVWTMYNNTDSDWVVMLYTKATNTVTRISLAKDPSYPHHDTNPQINNKGQVVYQSLNQGTDYELMFYDGATVTAVTNDNMTDESPMLNDNGDIVWMKSVVGSALSDIYLRDGVTKATTRITNTTVNEMNPRINNNGDIVWDGYESTSSSYQIYYYKRSNGTTTKVSTISNDNMFLEMNATGQLTWGAAVSASNYDVFVRSGLTGTNFNISNNSNDDAMPKINDNGWVTWYRDTGNTGTNDQILAWDGTMLNPTTPTTPTQLTNDSYDHVDPRINNYNELAWVATGGTGTTSDTDIFSAVTGTCATLICNDNNICTTDYCNPATGTCVFIPISCDDNNPCTADSCNTATGCVHTQLSCDDNNICTNDWCDTVRGCFHTTITCNDSNPCTTDTCDPVKGCIYTWKSCNDNNACTTDSCNTATGNCVNTQISCDDGNACTTDTCDTVMGCQKTSITGCCNFDTECNDNNACTTDTCNTATHSCTHTSKVCNDNNACTTDTCNPTTGQCVYTNNETICPSSTGNNFTMLDTGNNAVGGTNDIYFAWDGTRKTSVAVSGQISNALLSSTCAYSARFWSAHDLAVYGPGTYSVYTGCPAGSPGCGAGTPMTFTVKTGEIGIHMLFDWDANYNIDVVNVYTPNAVFNPKSPMWTNVCGTNVPCQPWVWSSYDWDGDGYNGGRMVDGPFPGFSPNFNLIKTGTIDPCCDAVKRCNDNNACTTDTCDSATGNCIHTTIVCNDNSACTTDTCSTTTGCVYTPIVCNDNNPCTSDTCNSATGCVFTPKVCDDNNACTDNHCNTTTGACYYTTHFCADGNACTTDTCNTSTGCVFTPIVCNDNNACTTDSCNTATGCVTTSLSCPGGSACDPASGCLSNVISTGNNFTLLAYNANIWGGTNDVKFTWDGTLQNTTTFANGTGPSNATISSDEPLANWLWYAKHVQVIGPGTYSVPLAGQTNRYEVTIPSGQIGAHMLLDWGQTGQATSCGKTDCNVDVWLAWQFDNAFATGLMYTGADDGTNTNAPAWDDPPVNSVLDGRPNAGTKVWGLVSVDLAGRITDSRGVTITNLPSDGIPGIKMKQGTYNTASANFNVKVVDPCADTATRCNDNNACTTDTCNEATGACIYTPVACNDGNACSTDTCNPATGCVFTYKSCDDNNACTNDWCSFTTGKCFHTAIFCDDNNVCTTDTCNSATGCVFTNNTAACTDNNACTVNDLCSGGVCVPGTPKVCPNAGVCSSATGCPASNVSTSGNNFTMLLSNGYIVGGTNDVKFTWDGTIQNATTFANGTGPANATISSDEPFYSWLWSANHVQVVGPGTYWVDLDGAGPSTNRYEVTIPAGRIGAHMLWNSGQTGEATSCGKTDCDIDVWIAWDFNDAFMTGKLFTGADDGTSSNGPALDDPPQPFVIDGHPNASTKVWDLVSVNVAGRLTNSTGGTLQNLTLNGIPGIKLLEGTFSGVQLNFNVMLQ